MDNLDYKTCPLKRATGDDVLVFQNVDITEDTEREVAEWIKKGEGRRTMAPDMSALQSATVTGNNADGGTSRKGSALL